MQRFPLQSLTSAALFFEAAFIAISLVKRTVSSNFDKNSPSFLVSFSLCSRIEPAAIFSRAFKFSMDRIADSHDSRLLL